MMKLPDQKTKGAVKLADGLTMEWLDEGRILVLTLEYVTRTAVDTYVEACKRLLKDPKIIENPVCVVQDISAHNVSLTPYFRKSLDEISDFIQHKHIHGYSAVVLRRGFMERIMRYFGNNLQRKTPSFPSHYFFDRSEAIDWLRQNMKIKEPV
jgi:hypothetical protein